MKTNRLLMVTTFMSVFLFGASLYAQQEIDPTWYDPWPAPNKVTAPPSRPQAAKQKHQAKIVSTSPEAQVGKVRSTRSVNRRILSQFYLSPCCHPSWDWAISGTPAFSAGNEVSLYSAVAGPPVWPLCTRRAGLAPVLDL